MRRTTRCGDVCPGEETRARDVAFPGLSEYLIRFPISSLPGFWKKNGAHGPSFQLFFFIRMLQDSIMFGQVSSYTS